VSGGGVRENPPIIRLRGWSLEPMRAGPQR
jgi:hypothetical protein